MNCEKYQELISCLIDGELSAQERAELVNHIAHCPECRAMYEDFAALSGIVEASMAEVPDSLHRKIMSGVKYEATRSKKAKKPLIVRLRPYMATAACLVVIVGAIFSLRDGVGHDTASNQALTSVNAGGTPSALADTADSPAESEEFDFYGFNSGVDSAEESVTADEPRAESQEMPNSAPSEGINDTAGVRAKYTPGSSIDQATLTTLMSDGSSESVAILDLEALKKALVPMDFDDEVEFVTSATLELVCGEQIFTLELYYAGEALIVCQNGEYYFASATVQEFLAIE